MSEESYSTEDIPAELRSQEDSWSARFQWLLDRRHGGNKSSLARALGLVTTQVSNILGGAIPGGDTLREAIRSHPDINPEWIVTGRRPRERPPPPAAAQRALDDVERAIEYVETLLRRARAESPPVTASCQPSVDGGPEHGRDEGAEQVTVTPDDEATGP